METRASCRAVGRCSAALETRSELRLPRASLSPSHSRSSLAQLARRCSMASQRPPPTEAAILPDAALVPPPRSPPRQVDDIEALEHEVDDAGAPVDPVDSHKTASSDTVVDEGGPAAPAPVDEHGASRFPLVDSSTARRVG